MANKGYGFRRVKTHYRSSDGQPLCGRESDLLTNVLDDVTCIRCARAMGVDMPTRERQSYIHRRRDDDVTTALCGRALNTQRPARASRDSDDVTCPRCVRRLHAIYSL